MPEAESFIILSKTRVLRSTGLNQAQVILNCADRLSEIRLGVAKLFPDRFEFGLIFLPALIRHVFRFVGVL